MYSKSIQKLISLFSKFPTVGPKTAARFVFYLLKLPETDLKELSEEINKLKKEVKICKFCYSPFEEGGLLCPICNDSKRDRSALCIVEKESDLASIEKTKKYKGLYFVLGGTISPLKKKEVKIRSAEALDRAKSPEAKEIIIALNPTTEGEATILYLERLFAPLNKKITRLGKGLPVGGELEYADEETLSSALESRR